MALTPEDLQAIAALLDSKIEPVKNDIAALQASQARIEDGHQTIREDIADLNEEIVPKINHMYDCLNGVQEKFTCLDVVEGKVEDHEHRLFAVEESLKKAE